MRFCALLLFVLLSVVTYGVVQISPYAWTTPDLKLALSIAWSILIAVWVGLFFVFRINPDSK